MNQQPVPPGAWLKVDEAARGSAPIPPAPRPAGCCAPKAANR
ncbi:hypothetical protein WJ977_12335 [Achromobacter xylosoxidans]